MFEGGLRNRIQTRAKDNCTCGAKRFCQPQCLPRSRLDFAFEVVNVDKRFHSTFSARILSASLSAISAGLSPVINSISVFWTGGFISSIRFTTADGAAIPRSSNNQTGMLALDALRMPMNDG